LMEQFWLEMKSQCLFDLHFLYVQGCWAFLYVFIGHLYFFSWELLVQFICPFSGLLILCGVNFWSSLYILVIHSLSYNW
jgi:hypothetical protein